MEARSVLSQRIEELRKERGMTQGCMASLLGKEGKKGRSTINNWEQDAAQIKSDDLINIGKTFGVSVDWLLGLSECPSLDEDMEIAQKTIGISEKAIRKVKNSEVPHTLSKLLEDPDFEKLVKEICVLYGQARETEEAYKKASETITLGSPLVFTKDEIEIAGALMDAAHYRYLIMRNHEAQIRESFAGLVERIAGTISPLLRDAEKQYRDEANLGAKEIPDSDNETVET